ncbi:MAG: hypothetical protein EXS63_03170 [Candidatus Omnitrophica bacterium]|nr:hypothetical protein [Candidatus Omnitrophota bacterium]
MNRSFLSFMLVLFCCLTLPAQLHAEEEKAEVESAQVADPASPEDAAEAVKAWEYPPVVNISKWGNELKIVVEPNMLMDRDKIPDIESVKLETEEGKFLGLKTYGPGEDKRRAEFMIDPAALKMDNVKITMNSRSEGDWSKVVPLKETPETDKEVSAYTQATATETSTEAEVAEKTQEPNAEATAPENSGAGLQNSGTENSGTGLLGGPSSSEVATETAVAEKAPAPEPVVSTPPPAPAPEKAAPKKKGWHW